MTERDGCGAPHRDRGMRMTRQKWYAEHKCRHAHCPKECENPQPFMLTGELVCGRCAIMFGEVTKMIPCTHETCGKGGHK